MTALSTSKLARLAVRHYPHHCMSNRVMTNHNRREWIKSVTFLGLKWKGHPIHHVKRLETPIGAPIVMLTPVVYPPRKPFN